MKGSHAGFSPLGCLLYPELKAVEIQKRILPCFSAGQSSVPSHLSSGELIELAGFGWSTVETKLGLDS